MPIFVFAFCWVVITIVLGAMGMRSFVETVFVALVPAGVVAAWFGLRRKSPVNGVYTVPGEPPLTATYASANLALDVMGRRLWIHDVTGRELIIDLDEVAAWEHTWTDTANAWGHRSRIRNELAFRLRLLDVPNVRVSFRRYSDAFNGNKNFEEASQWQARLTTLING